MEAIRTAIECGAIAGELLAKAREHRLKADFLERSAAWYSMGVGSALDGVGGTLPESEDVPPPTDFLRGLGRRTEAGQAARHGAGRRAGLEG
jgi:hypothetical protein